MSALAPIVEKVTRLIALAASPVENEARNAAFVACRLIREHGLRVGNAEPQVRVVYVDRTVTPQAPPRETAKRVTVRAKYPGRCTSCSGGFEAGDQIAWAKGEGSWCRACWREWR